MNSPGWAASLADMQHGQTRASKDSRERSPSTAATSPSVLLFAIQFPKALQLAAFTESDIWKDYVNDPTNDQLRHDYVPDHPWPDGDDWIGVSVSY